ncbi:MAG: acyltransferase [Candidatus Omnitrophica bacterium]|nr:acyltransferase [Candidatus Omnitrophota bacterium]
MNKLGILQLLCYSLYYFIAIHLPYGDRWGVVGAISNRIRAVLCKPLFKKTGKTFSVNKGVDFGFNGNLISLGECANLGNYAWVRGNGELIIGNHVMMGEDVVIYTQDHRITREGFDGYSVGAVTIKDHVWIGGRVILLKGITVGNNAVVGAGSVVTKDVPDNAIVAGNPARVIKMRDEL